MKWSMRCVRRWERVVGNDGVVKEDSWLLMVGWMMVGWMMVGVVMVGFWEMVGLMKYDGVDEGDVECVKDGMKMVGKGMFIWMTVFRVMVVDGIIVI